MTTTSETGYQLYDLLINAGFNDMYSRFIVSQAAHESANFTSPVFLNASNPFGIKWFPSDKIAIGKYGEYAKYENKGAAVQRYKQIFKSYGIIIGLNSLANFVDLLKKHAYFEASKDEYLRGCTWFYNLYFPEGWEKPHISGAGGSW